MQKIRSIIRVIVLFFLKLPKKVFAHKVGFILLGISSTLWFLIRVIPKPQRANYPCMQGAAPMMSGLVVYLLSLWGTVAAYRRTRQNILRSRYLLAGTFLAATLLFFVLFAAQNNLPSFANEKAATTNFPVGTGRGIFPGRVVWTFNPEVAKFDGKTGNWWDEANTLQAETDKMLKESLQVLSAKENEVKAWDALFVHFNLTKKNQPSGYTTGQKIAIKINQNNTTSHTSSKNINATPQMILSLLKSLINEAGVPQKCITVFDASRFVTDNIYNKCHAVYPEVIFVDNVGGNGRVKCTYVDNAIPFSVNNGALARGIASCAVEADYLINMALLKGHPGQGVTLCGKNWYGATSINNTPTNNSHANFNPDASGKDRYMTFVDYMGHKDLGEKTVLYLIDGIYASKTVSGIPSLRWQMKPFNNRWPSSIFVSQDPVAIDAVGLDFLRSEWPDLPDILYSEKYLIEAAQADNPPSKAFYDPEKDNSRCKSLGVAESWNNADKKQYSRNLVGSQGIELNFRDMSVMTGISKTNNSFQVTIYPNPAHDLLFVQNCDPNSRIQIFDLNGKLLASYNLSNNQIEISHLSKGQYIINITNKNQTFVKKFIKI
jgi:hypothetical protein